MNTLHIHKSSRVSWFPKNSSPYNQRSRCLQIHPTHHLVWLQGGASQGVWYHLWFDQMKTELNEKISYIITRIFCNLLDMPLLKSASLKLQDGSASSVGGGNGCDRNADTIFFKLCSGAWVRGGFSLTQVSMASVVQWCSKSITILFGFISASFHNISHHHGHLWCKHTSVNNPTFVQVSNTKQQVPQNPLHSENRDETTLQCI